MKELSYDQFAKMAREVLSSQNRRRLAVIFKGIAQKDQFLEYSMVKSIKELRADLDYQPRIKMLTDAAR